MDIDIRLSIACSWHLTVASFNCRDMLISTENLEMLGWIIVSFVQFLTILVTGEVVDCLFKAKLTC